jgi:hypothetical protein
MDLNRFAQCCQAFGAERRRWPAADQVLYDQFAATTSGATLIAEAQRVDNFLNAFEIQDSDNLSVNDYSLRMTRPAWRRYAIQIGAMAVCAVLGIVIGYFQGDYSTDVGLVAQFLLGPTGSQE